VLRWLRQVARDHEKLRKPALVYAIWLTRYLGPAGVAYLDQANESRELGTSDRHMRRGKSGLPATWAENLASVSSRLSGSRRQRRLCPLRLIAGIDDDMARLGSAERRLAGPLTEVDLPCRRREWHGSFWRDAEAPTTGRAGPLTEVDLPS
jgi:hypothetical protein